MDRDPDTLSDKLVVVIDDDVDVLDAMAGLLQGWGYQVVAVPTPDLAIDKLQGRRPNLIISDYRLAHGRIGVEAIEQVRKAFAIPAFVISADVQAHALEEYSVFNKPLTPTALQAAVSKAVNVESLSSDTDYRFDATRR